MPKMNPDAAPPRDLTTIYMSLWQDVENAVKRRDDLLRHFGFSYEASLSGGVEVLRPLPDWVRAQHEGSKGPEYKLLDENWIEVLARDCASRYAISPTTADVLSKLHALRAERLQSWHARFNARTVLGIAVAALSVAATQVPRDSFKALGWEATYGWYRLTLLAVLLAVALLVASAALPARRSWMKLDRTLHVMETVLTFCNNDSDRGSR